MIYILHVALRDSEANLMSTFETHGSKWHQKTLLSAASFVACTPRMYKRVLPNFGQKFMFVVSSSEGHGRNEGCVDSPREKLHLASVYTAIA